jgi:transketolase C-terminal domain/subunit
VRGRSMHTVKPLDADAVLRPRRDCRAVMTVEEHSVFGGLGEACAAVLMQAGIHVPFRIIGFPDESWSQEWPGASITTASAQPDWQGPPKPC